MKHKQQGVALIIVLLVVALASIVATQMGSRLQLQLQRAANIKGANQAYWYAMGAEQFAQKSLRELFENDGDNINLNQAWAAQNLAFPLEGGGIEARLVDMQSCFNLNALKLDDDNDALRDALKDVFFRILQNTDVEIPSLNAETLRDSLVDWLDTDRVPFGSYGTEDSEYRSRPQPYLSANGFMGHKSELRLVNGAEPSWLAQILRYVCVIPNSDLMKININTMTSDDAPLLRALLNLPTLAEATDIINSRPADGYENISDFFQEPEIAALSLNDLQREWFDIKTNYFLLHTKTLYNGALFRMSSVLSVDTSNNVTVIRREFGGTQ